MAANLILGRAHCGRSSHVLAVLAPRLNIVSTTTRDDLQLGDGLFDTYKLFYCSRFALIPNHGVCAIQRTRIGGIFRNVSSDVRNVDLTVCVTRVTVALSPAKRRTRQRLQLLLGYFCVVDRDGASLQIVGTIFRLHAVDRYNFVPRVIYYHSYDTCSNTTFCLSIRRNRLLYTSYTTGTKGAYGLSRNTLCTLQRVYLISSGGVFTFGVSINDLRGLSTITRHCTLARVSGPLGDCSFLGALLP